jgi:hypothetical protein
MKVSGLLHRYLPWLNLPLGFLVALLQRTPAVRVLLGGSEYAMAAHSGELLRAAFAAASLGAVHSLAGATTYVQSPINPVHGEVGTRLSVAFTFTGAPSDPQHWVVLSGQLPPGLSFIPAPLNGVIRTRDPAITGTPTQAGNFSVRVRAIGLAGESDPVEIRFEITGTVAATPPTITTQPQSQSAMLGASATFSVQATGSPPPVFQWTKNGANIFGATTPNLLLTSVETSDAGTYAVVVSNSAGAITSNSATLTVLGGGSDTARLSNLSVRTTMAAGQRLIVGFFVDGGSRQILVRAAGPALAALGLGGTMADPNLELYSGSTLVLSNDNWSTLLADVFASVGAFAFPAGSRDAAFQQSMSNSASVHALGTGAGIVLVEAYDTGSGNTPRMTNLSARNRVGTGDDILIAGFAISGTGSKRLLIRAAGPALSALGVPGVLANPRLELYSSAGLKLNENEDWAANLIATFSNVGAFPFPAASRDAALIVELSAGATYTVQVRGSDGGTGEALIEIYEVP